MGLNLLPAPRFLKLGAQKLILPRRLALQLDGSLPPAVVCFVAERLQVGGLKFGADSTAIIRAIRSDSAPAHAEGYELTIDQHGVRVEFLEVGGLRAAVATLRQLFREHGRRLPFLKIRDWPDFPRRGVMLDVSRGRVPKLATLLDLADKLADFKINELQLYTEHTFAYQKYKSVWRGWGALTAAEIRKLDARCRELGIDLVPNQNSFGHLREFLTDAKLKRLAEVSAPYPGATGDFLRYPSTLAPNHHGTLPFLRGLYDELLPNFSSKFFNVGCDETWDLGRGQSRLLCARLGKGRVYLGLLEQIQREVSTRGRKMMFWGDIILHHPQLIRKLPRDVIALNWGYEASHPFESEAALFAKSKIPFYVCPGTSTWMTLVGRHDNAFANLRRSAKAGLKHGAMGYLITDWGDGGHPQPLAVSWLPYLYGASVAWCGKTFDEKKTVSVLSRDVFGVASGRVAKAALALGLAHRKFGYRETNQTPFGTPIAAPPPERREMFCRNGLKLYARIPAAKVRAALAEVEKQILVLKSRRAISSGGKILVQELELAARMAAASCRILLWQQALAAGKSSLAARLAKSGVRELQQLDKEFNVYWPTRNKGSTRTCSPFLQWRIDDYHRGKLHFPPVAARVIAPKLKPAE